MTDVSRPIQIKTPEGTFLVRVNPSMEMLQKSLRLTGDPCLVWVAEISYRDLIGGKLPPYVEKGMIIKEKIKGETTRYDFRYSDKDGYEVMMQGLSRSFNKEYWNYAKLISGVLRHGMPIQYVIELVQNLNVEEDSINTWKNGIARALKKYVPDGIIDEKEKCPNCGEKLIFEDGCKHCRNCGYSKCG